MPRIAQWVSAILAIMGVITLLLAASRVQKSLA
jgi:hypothetical protein